MNSARHTTLKIVLVAVVLVVLYALFAPSARGGARPAQLAGGKAALAANERLTAAPARAMLASMIRIERTR